MNKKILGLFTALMLTMNCVAWATPTSTINPAVPAYQAPLTSAMFRGQFVAAYNDINAIWAALNNVQTALVLTTNGSSGAATLIGNTLNIPQYSGGGGGTPGGTGGQVQYNNAGAFAGFTVSGDATLVTSSGVLTLNTVNGNAGSYGSSTAIPSFTTNAKGLLTAAGTHAVIAPALTLTGDTLAPNVLFSSVTLLGSSASLPGNPTTTTQSPGDNSTRIATTAYVQANAASQTLTSAHIYVGNGSNVSTDRALSGDATLSNTGAITVTKTSGSLFAPSATTDTTNAANISSGVLSVTRGGTGATSFGNGLTNSSSVLDVTQGADRAVTGTTDTITAADRGTYVVYKNVAKANAAIASASSTGLTQGFAFVAQALCSSGGVTITPTGSLIHGLSAFFVPPCTSAYIRSDNTNFLLDYSSSALGVLGSGGTGAIQYASSSGRTSGVVLTGLVKANGTSPPTVAVAGTDYDVPTSAGTGLTRTSNVYYVSTSQNIAKLSNLTTNGVVKTSGGNGTLTVDTTAFALQSTTINGLDLSTNRTLTPANIGVTGAISFSMGCTPGGSVPTTGMYFNPTVPYNATITGWHIDGDTSGSVVLDIKRSGTSIIGGGNAPTLSSTQHATAAPSGWTSTAITAGDHFAISISSIATLTCVEGTIDLLQI